METHLTLLGAATILRYVTSSTTGACGRLPPPTLDGLVGPSGTVDSCGILLARHSPRRTGPTTVCLRALRHSTSPRTRSSPSPSAHSPSPPPQPQNRVQPPSSRLPLQQP